MGKEETWRLKRRAIWLECGDENTKFFHALQKEGKLLILLESEG
jgi:hypothetical protein